MSHPQRRDSLRYEGFDYSSPAGIFVTVATHYRQPIFGTLDERNSLTPPGIAVLNRWRAIPNRFPDVGIDAFAIMPDHIHGILWMGWADAVPPTSCGDVIRWFKTAVVSDFKVGVRDHGWPRYENKLWQRDFYDHIIRGEKDLTAIRQYIDANPYV